MEKIAENAQADKEQARADYKKAHAAAIDIIQRQGAAALYKSQAWIDFCNAKATANKYGIRI